ncbi:nuclear transport factor 2 family protein [Photobacterium rosenbergii]|uniref:Nuclear transport factor 2 family protein n=1 Tax=Photobacterium rosenbergii TaxID=294936 RepID=A0ABU3ZI27_9GAMM|nr:nuclear transport factor 2 family protein [Photobacterium rosenbergii]MDV5169790.1 nuclear transport factor 2 family protein [Photobacterium rosenbergii]
MSRFQPAKKLVREYFDALEKCQVSEVQLVMDEFMSDDYEFLGSYPFRERSGKAEVAAKVWEPLKQSLTRMQRRQDIFIGGQNEFNDEIWVMSMGHFMGLFDTDWLGIKHTGKIQHLRYAEFSCIENGKITKTGLFLDLIGFMNQAGCYPLPPMTGSHFVYPGPRNHDGLLFEDAPAEESAKTQEVMNLMVDDIDRLNKTAPFADMETLRECLRLRWQEDMIWYGPCGIGAQYTIPRYQKGHQMPFRSGLKDKVFNGHVCRFAEGSFSCFFGWPNLSNKPIGGFLGLPGGEVKADMQVVDVYYRKDDKLSENWVLIDIPYWLKQQGLDVLERTTEITNPKL